MNIAPLPGQILPQGDVTPAMRQWMLAQQQGTYALDVAVTAKPAHNLLINGDFSVWQRGTSFTATIAGGNNCADRWQTSSFTVPNFSMSRQAGPTGFQYAVRVQRTPGSAVANPFYLLQNMETADSVPLRGRTLTLSVWVRVGADYSHPQGNINLTIASGTGTDQNVATGYTGLTFSTEAFPVTQDWSFASMSWTVPSNANEVCVTIGESPPSGTAGANDYFEVAGAQLEIGDTPSAFDYRPFGDELALCQRYFQKSFPYATAPAQNTGVNTGAARYIPWVAGVRTNLVFVQLPARMRSEVPTVVFYNPAAANGNWRNISLGADSGIAAQSGAGNQNFGIANTQVAGDAITHTLLVHWTADAEL